MSRLCALDTCANEFNGKSGSKFCSPDCAEEARAQRLRAEALELLMVPDGGVRRLTAGQGSCRTHNRRGCLMPECLPQNTSF